MGRKASDPCGDDHADGGEDQNGDPDLPENLKSQRCASVEQDVTGTEQENDLVQRRAGLDLDQAERVRAEHDTGDQEHRDIRDPDLLRKKRGHRSDGQNETAGKQRLPGDLDGW